MANNFEILISCHHDGLEHREGHAGRTAREFMLLLGLILGSGRILA